MSRYRARAVPKHSALKPRFHVKKKRLKPWPKKRREPRARNLILSLIGGEKSSLRGLALRSGLRLQTCWRILSGRSPHVQARTAQRLARALGVSTDTFLDILEVYAPSVPKTKSNASSELVDHSDSSVSE